MVYCGALQIVNANGTLVCTITVCVHVCIQSTFAWHPALELVCSADVCGVASGMRIMRRICGCGWCHSACACCGVLCIYLQGSYIWVDHDAIKWCVRRRMPICMGKVLLWGIESRVQVGCKTS